MTSVTVASAVLRFNPERLMHAPVSKWVIGSKSADIHKVSQHSLDDNVYRKRVAVHLNCCEEGWNRHTRDGQYVLVGDSGSVISTSTRQVNTVPRRGNSREYLEIDWQNGVPTTTQSRRSGA